jgi:6-phosphogluconolactonase
MAVVTVVDDEPALAATAAEQIASLVERAIGDRGTAVICLTGGTTPERLYELLGDDRHPWCGRIDWQRVHVFWGDERHVPPDHPDSNFGVAHRALLSRVDTPAAQVHRMRGEEPDPREAARQYEVELRSGFAAAGRSDQTFDLMLLGLGEDAHIASIFPGSPIVDERSVRVAAAWTGQLKAWRITLTPAALLDARHILLLVSGDRKADAVHAALDLPENVRRYPAQLLRAAGDRVEWIIDRAAARRHAAPHA